MIVGGVHCTEDRRAGHTHVPRASGGRRGRFTVTPGSDSTPAAARARAPRSGASRWPHRRTDALRRLAEVLLAVLQAESTLHRKIALHLPRSATLESKTRTVALHDAQLTPQDVTDVLLPLLPDGKLTLIMDRTTWRSGQTPLNILVLGALLGGAVIPLVWLILPSRSVRC